MEYEYTLMLHGAGDLPDVNAPILFWSGAEWVYGYRYLNGQGLNRFWDEVNGKPYLPTAWTSMPPKPDDWEEIPDPLPTWECVECHKEVPGEAVWCVWCAAVRPRETLPEHCRAEAGSEENLKQAMSAHVKSVINKDIESKK